VYATGNVLRTSTFPLVVDFSTIKFAPCGTLLWQRLYNNTGSGADEAVALAVNSSGDVYVTGQSASAKGAGLDYATIKYDTNGEQLWVARYDGPHTVMIFRQL